MNTSKKLGYAPFSKQTDPASLDWFLGKVLMEFTLKYQGVLPPTSSREARLLEKQQIRLFFHEQLQELWTTDSRLKTINPKELKPPILKGRKFDVERPIIGEKDFFYRYSVGGFDFVPLINTPIEAHCHLSIRLHAPTGPGNILFYGGDLDNRLKTIFDALRMPTALGELAESASTDGELIFCLLENDNLITRLSIESFRLLKNCPDKDYVEMDIDVTVRAVTPMMGTVPLLFP